MTSGRRDQKKLVQLTASTLIRWREITICSGVRRADLRSTVSNFLRLLLFFGYVAVRPRSSRHAQCGGYGALLSCISFTAPSSTSSSPMHVRNSQTQRNHATRSLQGLPDLRAWIYKVVLISHQGLVIQFTCVRLRRDQRTYRHWPK